MKLRNAWWRRASVLFVLFVIIECLAFAPFFSLLLRGEPDVGKVTNIYDGESFGLVVETRSGRVSLNTTKGDLDGVRIGDRVQLLRSPETVILGSEPSAIGGWTLVVGGIAGVLYMICFIVPVSRPWYFVPGPISRPRKLKASD